MTFTQAITPGIDLIHEITFPFSRKKVYMKWDIYLSTDRYINNFNLTGSNIGDFEFYGYLFSNGDYYDFQQEFTKQASFQVGKHLLYTYDSYDGYHQEEYSALEEIGFYDGDLDVWFEVSKLNAYIDDEAYEIDNYYIQMKVEASRPTELASTVSCSSTYLTDTLYIMINKQDNEFTTTIDFQLGDLSETIVTQTTKTMVSWVIPASYVSQFGSTELQKTATLRATTYYNGLEIGASEYTFNVLASTNMRGPQINVPTILPVDTLSKNLLGNTSACIKYISTMRVTPTFIVEEGYTLASWNITNGDNEGSKTLSPTKYVDFKNVESPIFTITATDNRGFTNTKSFTVNVFYDYVKLTCNLAATKPDLDGNATVTISGNFYNNSLKTTRNTLTLNYRIYNSDTDTYSDWMKVTPQLNGNTYSIQFDVTGLGYKTKYTFQAEAADKIMTVLSSEASTVGQPIFDWNEESFHITPDLELNNQIIMDRGSHIDGNYGLGKKLNALIPCDSDGYTKLGYGNYDLEIKGTNIYGNEVNIISNNSVKVNGIDLTVAVKMAEHFATLADEETDPANNGPNYESFSFSFRPIGDKLAVFIRPIRKSATTGSEKNELVGELVIPHYGIAQTFWYPIIEFHGDMYGGTTTSKQAYLTADVTDWDENNVTVEVRLRKADSGITNLYSAIYIPMVFNPDYFI